MDPEEITTERRIAELEAKHATIQQEVKAISAWLQKNVRHPDFCDQVRRMHSKQADLQGLVKRIERISENKPEYGHELPTPTPKQLPDE